MMHVSDKEDMLRLYLIGVLERDDDFVATLDNILVYGAKRFHVNINSTGGSTSTFLSIKNAMLLHDEEFKSTEILGACGSAAALFFTLSKKRIVNESSMIIIHSSNFIEVRGVNLTNDLFVLQHENRHIYSKFLDEGWVSRDEYDILTLKVGTKTSDINISAREALERGLATHIRLAGKLIPAKEYLEYIKN